MKDKYGLLSWADDNKTIFPRRQVAIYFDCHAPTFLFEYKWEKLSEEAKEFYDKYYIPCEGTGDISCSCSDCPFVVEDWEDI